MPTLPRAVGDPSVLIYDKEALSSCWKVNKSLGRRRRYYFPGWFLKKINNIKFSIFICQRKKFPSTFYNGMLQWVRRRIKRQLDSHTLRDKFSQLGDIYGYDV